MSSGQQETVTVSVSGQPPQEMPVVPQAPPNVPVFGTINSGPVVKIGLLIPTNISVDVRWAFSFQQILGELGRYPGSSYMADFRYGLAETRESLVTEALAKIPDLTHVMFVDTDVIPLIPNGIQLLLQDDKPVISGVYFSSLMTGAAAWRGEVSIPVDNQPDPIQQVDKTGFGFTLIQRKVFDLLAEKGEPRPWFYYLIDSGTHKMQSEDFYFIDKLTKYGIKPWVDLRVQCGHIKTMVINPNGTIQVPPHQNQNANAQGQK